MDETKKEGADLTAALQSIAKGQQEIIALLNKANAPPPGKDEDKKDPKDEEDEEKKKADKSQDKEKETKDPKSTKEPVLTLSEDGITMDQFEKAAEKMGFKKVSKSPAPGTTDRTQDTLTQGGEQKKGKLPTAEQNIQALIDMDMSALNS